MAGFYGRTGIEFKDGLTDNLVKLEYTIRPAATRAVLEAAQLIAEAAYQYANVSPGVKGHGRNGEHMRDEIKVVEYQKDYEVTARIQIDTDIIPYAPHQEFGPRGNGFMRRAMDENRAAAHEIQKRVMLEELGLSSKEFASKVRFRAVA